MPETESPEVCSSSWNWNSGWVFLKSAMRRCMYGTIRSLPAMRIEPSGRTYFASFDGSGAAAFARAATSDRAMAAMAFISIELRELCGNFRGIQRQVALGVRGDRVLPFIRERHCEVSPHERIDRLSPQAAHIDVDGTVVRVTAAPGGLPLGAPP